MSWSCIRVLPLRLLCLGDGVAAPLVQELRARDDALNETVETEIVGNQLVVHLLDRDVVRKLKRAAQRVAQQLARQAVDVIVLAVVADVSADAVKSGAFAAVGEGRVG